MATVDFGLRSTPLEDGKYAKVINQGTGPNAKARGMTAQNYATLKALLIQTLRDKLRHNLTLAGDNCVQLLEQTFPRYHMEEITGEESDINLGELLGQFDISIHSFNADTNNTPLRITIRKWTNWAWMQSSTSSVMEDLLVH